MSGKLTNDDNRESNKHNSAKVVPFCGEETSCGVKPHVKLRRIQRYVHETKCAHDGGKERKAVSNG
jgi:hypothetical protein